jgi:hypothetical protein
MNSKQNKALTTVFITLMIALIIVSIVRVDAAPTGAQVTNISETHKNASQPQYNNGTKGAINIVNLHAEQQDMKWKAYVGNITSNFVLDDADDYSIYQWNIQDFTGQVYITRSPTVTWSPIDCASISNKQTEDTTLTHQSTSADSVNSTFIQKLHKGFSVGTSSINPNQCYSIATRINDTDQTPSASQPFVELLLWDSTGSNMVYTTFVSNDVSSYRSDGTPGTTYDFQAIVPENATASVPAIRYYFYLELTSS